MSLRNRLALWALGRLRSQGVRNGKAD